MKYTNEAGTIELPEITVSAPLAKFALDVYMYCNQEDIDVPHPLYMFKASLEEIYKKHGIDRTIKAQVDAMYPYTTLIEKNHKVLLAFSGGLDSMYQALYLREKGYHVILFHLKNVNYYTNGKENSICENFSQKYNFPIIFAEFKQNTKKDNPYKKHWRENSFKNILIYSAMVDYCQSFEIQNISSGDDLRLKLEDTVTGTNVADAREVTLPFMKNIRATYNIDFIPVEVQNKAERLKLLEKYNALDDFYSCVNPGRFNQSNHKRIEEKFGVKLEKYNCGVCRKCAFHSLLRYYFMDVKYPKEFIDFCWEKIQIGADYEFFKESLPVEQRIKNLIEY